MGGLASHPCAGGESPHITHTETDGDGDCTGPARVLGALQRRQREGLICPRGDDLRVAREAAADAVAGELLAAELATDAPTEPHAAWIRQVSGVRAHALLVLGRRVPPTPSVELWPGCDISESLSTEA